MTSFYEPSDFKRFLISRTVYDGSFTSPYGLSYILTTSEYLLGLYFPANDPEKTEIKNDFQKKYQVSSIPQNQDLIKNWGEKIFSTDVPSRLPFKISGTPFQCAVWQYLSNIPAGHTKTYKDIAEALNRSRAVRAVGTAVGQNPLSFVLPCHRILRQDGTLGGYRWGTDLKQKILTAESNI